MRQCGRSSVDFVRGSSTRANGARSARSVGALSMLSGDVVMRRPAQASKKAQCVKRHASWARRASTFSQSFARNPTALRLQPLAPASPTCGCHCLVCSQCGAGASDVPELELVLVLLTPAWCCSSCWRRCGMRLCWCV